MIKRSFLLDTNVVSELRKARPEPSVVDWLKSTPAKHKFLSVLTIGKIRKGIAARKRTDPRAADAIERWASRVTSEFADRILPITLDIARMWGDLSAARPIAVVDGLLAATALAFDMTFVTRNIRHVENTGVTILDPWT